MKTFKYGNNSQQFANLYRPKNNALLPIIIVIHGGYWKDNHSLDSYPTIAIVKELLKLNVAIWNLEYRRMNAEGENILAPWPSIFLDVLTGIDHLSTIAEAEKLDLNRILIIGHSAGAHLSTWAACRDKIPKNSILYRPYPLKIKRVISIAGILDLLRVEDIEKPDQIRKLLATASHKDNEKYRACNPNQLHNNDIAITVIHGDQDKTVNINQAKSYCSNAKNNVKLIVLPNADHFDMLPIEGNCPVYWPLIKSIMQKQINHL